METYIEDVNDAMNVVSYFFKKNIFWCTTPYLQWQPPCKLRSCGLEVTDQAWRGMANDRARLSTHLKSF